MLNKIQIIIGSMILGESEKIEQKEASILLKWISIIIGIALSLVLLILVIDYFGHQSLNLGTFGDFFGGVLNPILTLFTLTALGITMIMQRVQLHDAKVEAQRNLDSSRIQAFETTFFNLITLHNQIVSELKLDPTELGESWDKLHRASNITPYTRQLSSADGRHTFSRLFNFLDLVVEYGGATSHLEAYNFVQVRHNHIFGHYFRNLYQILRFLQHSAISIGKQFEEKFYSNILRAQLSANELRALLYNCNEELVDKGDFRKLLIRFRLLEHLPLTFDSEQGILSQSETDTGDAALYHQYFYYMPAYGNGQWTSGAFGENPAVAEYLLSRRGSLKISPS